MERVIKDSYSFADLRNGCFTYVDKTDVLYAVVSGDCAEERVESV